MLSMLIKWSKTYHCRGLCLDSLQFYPHSYKMPRNKCSAQEIEGHIHELVDDNLKRTKNVDLELKFQKYQREKNKLDAFRLKLDQKKT